MAAMMNGKEAKYDPVEFGSFEMDNVDFYSIGANPTWEDYDEEEEYIEHTGNECQEGYTTGQYFNMAVIIRNNPKYLIDGEECDTDDEDEAEIDQYKIKRPEELERFANIMFSSICVKSSKKSIIQDHYVTKDQWNKLWDLLFVSHEERGKTWDTLTKLPAGITDMFFVTRKMFVQWYVKTELKYQEEYAVAYSFFKNVDKDNKGYLTLKQWPSLSQDIISALTEEEHHEVWNTISAYRKGPDAVKIDEPIIYCSHFMHWYSRYATSLYESENED